MKLIPTRVRESKAWQESEFDSRGHFHREGFNPATGSPVPKKDVFYWPLRVVYLLLGNELHNGVTKPSEAHKEGCSTRPSMPTDTSGKLFMNHGRCRYMRKERWIRESPLQLFLSTFHCLGLF